MIEILRPALFDDLESVLVGAEKQALAEPAGRVSVRELQGLGAQPADGDDRYQAVREDAADGSVRLEVFELGHWLQLDR